MVAEEPAHEGSETSIFRADGASAQGPPGIEATRRRGLSEDLVERNDKIMLEVVDGLFDRYPIVSNRGEYMHKYHRRQTLRAVVVAGVLAASALPAMAQAPADNTKVNTRDRATGAATADQQKDNASDRALTQTIRRALTQDKTLSSYAHNVKIISQGGQVTLKGPVRTEEEKRLIEAKAVEVAGVGNVTNQMSVAPAKSGKR
jgi:hypothetical protein